MNGYTSTSDRGNAADTPGTADLHFLVPLLMPLVSATHGFILPAAPLVQARKAARAIMGAQPPDTVIQARKTNRPFLQRWHLLCSDSASIYLHRFLSSDDDWALHTHPADSLSVILSGSYLEETPADPHDPAGDRMRTRRFDGDAVVRKAKAPHRIALETDGDGVEQPAEALFILGPRTHDWGFWCPDGWRGKDDFFARGCS